MRTIVLIAHNLRSCHNVGSLLRTAEGLGVQQVFLTGYTPYPLGPDDPRLPHMAAKITRQINKTALGAETTQAWQRSDSIDKVLAKLRGQGFTLAAIEQVKGSTPLPQYKPSQKIALLVGREVEGIETEVLARVDKVLEIPMFGTKESFNVAQA
ncbi:MAG: TrmH family RNA methyltransferase, partial [Patescibacteria group bacterium]